MFLGTVKEQNKKLKLPVLFKYNRLTTIKNNKIIKTLFNYFERMEEELKDTKLNPHLQYLEFVRLSRKEDDEELGMHQWMNCET